MEIYKIKGTQKFWILSTNYPIGNNLFAGGLVGQRDNEKMIVFSARRFKYGLEAFALNNDMSQPQNLTALLNIARKHPFLADDVYRAINLSRKVQ